MSARRLHGPSPRFDPHDLVVVMCGSPEITDGPVADTGGDVANGCARRDGMPSGFPVVGSADAGDGTRCRGIGSDARSRRDLIAQDKARHEWRAVGHHSHAWPDVGFVCTEGRRRGRRRPPRSSQRSAPALNLAPCPDVLDTLAAVQWAELERESLEKGGSGQDGPRYARLMSVVLNALVTLVTRFRQLYPLT